MQLRLNLEPQLPNQNAHFFNADGTPRRMLWCSDAARKGGPCPYTSTGRGVPLGECCKDIEAAG